MPSLLIRAGPFVDAQVGADAVAGAVVEVEAVPPQGRAGEGVDLGAGGAFREDGERRSRSCP